MLGSSILFNIDDLTYFDLVIISSTLQYFEKWDEFVETSRDAGSASEKNTDFVIKASVALKLITMSLTFAMVLGAGVVFKGNLMFILAQMTKTHITTCHNGTVQELQADDTVPWLW